MSSDGPAHVCKQYQWVSLDTRKADRTLTGRRATIAPCRAVKRGGRDPCLGELSGRVWGAGPGRWRATPGQQAAVCPPPILEIESGGYRKNFETGPCLSNSLPQREGARLPPGARRASRLLFQGFHPVPGALWGAGSSAPRLRAERPDSSLAGSAGQLHVARRGRIRWVMWRRCRTCPCATLETPPGLRSIARTSPLPNAAQTPRRRLLGVGNHMCWAGVAGVQPFQAVRCRWSSRVGCSPQPALCACARERRPAASRVAGKAVWGPGGLSATPPALRRPSLASSSHIGQQQDSQ